MDSQNNDDAQAEQVLRLLKAFSAIESAKARSLILMIVEAAANGAALTAEQIRDVVEGSRMH